MLLLKFILLVFSLHQIALVESNVTNEEAQFLNDVAASLGQAAEFTDELWSSIEENTPQTCDVPFNEIKNAVTNLNPSAKYVHGDLIAILCLEGYKTRSNLTEQSIKCLLGNQWSTFQPCEEVCKTSPEIRVNSVSDWNSGRVYGHDDKVILTCNEGFRTESDAFTQDLICLPGNKWSIAEDCSVETCTLVIEGIENAITNYSPDKIYSTGDEIEITCEEGFKTTSKTAKQKSTCLPNNAWTRFEHCLPICPAPFSKHGDLCVFHDATNRTWGQARKNCKNIKEEYDSKLAVLSTKSEQINFLNYVSGLDDGLDDSGWLAAHDMFEEGWFIWIDGSDLVPHVPEFSFEIGQPDNTDGDEHCVAFHPNGLEDALCGQEKTSFCEITMK